MRETTQFNVCIDEILLKEFDRLIEQKRFINRAEATRSLIRDSLYRTVRECVNNVDNDGKEMVGTVTLLYNRQGRAVSEKLSRYKDAHSNRIITCQNIHLDDRNSLEILVIRGEAQTVSRIADELIHIRGIRHGNLVMTPAGDGLN
jgi:CopG family transcriptional regulator, nickel-responsive regulator